MEVEMRGEGVKMRRNIKKEMRRNEEEKVLGGEVGVIKLGEGIRKNRRKEEGREGE